MAKLYRSNGTVEEIQPAGPHFTLKELQTLVGGYIELVYTKDGLLMILDEEGKLKGKPINLLATELYKYGSHDPIVGDVVVGTKLELDGPEDEDVEEDEAPDDEFSGDRDEEVGQPAEREPVSYETLTQLQYAVPVPGESFRLYIFEADGFHDGGHWFRREPKYLDEEITVAAAETLARQAIDAGKEVRVTDGGDLLVYHVRDHVKLYPAGAENVWATL